MDFGDDFVSSNTAKTNGDDIDPAAEFLAREQSMLGDLEAEINAVSATNTNTHDDGGSELLGIGNSGGGGVESSTGSFEMIGSSSIGAGGSNGVEGNGGSNDVLTNAPTNSTVEPEKIRKWREEQKQRLAEKDREEELKKEELRQQARKELEDWFRQTEESIAKTKAAARQAEKQTAALENGGMMEPGTEWERIAKLCDFNPKVNKSGRDVSRMRSIYLHLKQNPIPIRGRNF